ncbi:hypothetical protein ACTMU2_08190 [Cupriavidus basilensis]
MLAIATRCCSRAVRRAISLRLEEGRRVAAWLRHIRDTVPVHEGGEQRPARWSDMHLLVRRKTHLPDYERALREAGIPC